MHNLNNFLAMFVKWPFNVCFCLLSTAMISEHALGLCFSIIVMIQKAELMNMDPKGRRQSLYLTDAVWSLNL